jgi:hypothetical protein
MSQFNNHVIAVVAAIAIGLGASLPAFSQGSQTPAPQSAPPMSGMSQGEMMGHARWHDGVRQPGRWSAGQ